VSHYVSEIAFKVFPACDVIFDFDKASPTSGFLTSILRFFTVLTMGTVQPKINIQTAGHVSGIAYYYQRKDVESADDVWPDTDVCGVSVHPVYGGWFAFRAVIVLKVTRIQLIRVGRSSHYLKHFRISNQRSSTQLSQLIPSSPRKTASSC